MVGSLKWRGGGVWIFFSQGGGLLKMKRGEGVWIIFSTWWALGGGREGGVLDYFFKHVGYWVWMGVRFLFLQKEWNLGAGLGDGGESFLWFIYGC
jgi:hypothetical protein